MADDALVLLPLPTVDSTDRNASDPPPRTGTRLPVRASRVAVEMVVVVVSILIAFSLDAWWDRRGEARAEAAHLRALASDFRQNVDRLAALVDREERVAGASLALLRLAASADSPSAPPPADSVSRLLAGVFNSARFDPVLGAYEAVVGSGGLAQIRDDSLRIALAEFASLLDGRYHERFSNEVYLDFVRSFTGRLGFAEAVLAADPGRSAGPPPASAAQLRLLQDPRFREHLALRYAAERDVAGYYRGLLEKAERILDLLPAESAPADAPVRAGASP